MSKDTGGPAFPCDLTSYDDEVRIQYQGMTLRDYFAAKALQAFLRNQKPQNMDQPAITWARDAYEFADAMLKARTA